MASLHDAALSELFEQHRPRVYTTRTITDLARLRAELARVRVEGYATDDQEYLEDVWATAEETRGQRPRRVAESLLSRVSIITEGLSRSGWLNICVYRYI